MIYQWGFTIEDKRLETVEENGPIHVQGSLRYYAIAFYREAKVRLDDRAALQPGKSRNLLFFAIGEDLTECR